MIRSDLTLKCPWELPITQGCCVAGEQIDQMYKDPNQIQLSANILTMKNIKDPKKCKYAGAIDGDRVDCSAPSNQKMIQESPLYYRPMSGTGPEGMNTFPIGYYNDNVLDRGFYAGMTGGESLMSMTAGITQHTGENGSKSKGNFMALAKTAQHTQAYGLSHPSANELDGFLVDPEDLKDFGDLNLGDIDMKVELEPESEKETEVLMGHPEIEIEGDVEVQVSPEEGGELSAKKEFEFTLPNVPGAEDQQDLAIEEEEPEPTDPYKWTLKTFPEWLEYRLKNVPPHSGRDIAGCERAIAYLKWLDGEISKASRQDIKNELDISLLEKARNEIKSGIQRLEDRLEALQKAQTPKKKKKAAVGDQIVKNAADFYNTSINVPLFINYIAKVCVNSMVSGGHDAEDVFKKLATKYKLNDREQVEVLTVLNDWGAIAAYRDRGFKADETIDISSPDNFDWAASWMS